MLLITKKVFFWSPTPLHSLHMVRYFWIAYIISIQDFQVTFLLVLWFSNGNGDFHHFEAITKLNTKGSVKLKVIQYTDWGKYLKSYKFFMNFKCKCSSANGDEVWGKLWFKFMILTHKSVIKLKIHFFLIYPV